MDVIARLQILRDSLPSNGSVTFTRADLCELLGEQPAEKEKEGVPIRDLTVHEVASITGRKPNTVRDWIRAGKLDAYQFNGREYQITRSSLEKYLEEQRKGKHKRTEPKTRTNLGRWREVRNAA